jgi:peptide/nickel transport system permease protein
MASLRCRPRVWWVLRRDARARFGGILLIVICALAIGAPILSGDNPLATHPADQLLPPGAAHLAGTDLLGRDVWSRLLWGGRLSLAAGMLAALLTAVPGGLLGLLSGYAGGHVDALVMRVVDVLLAFPSLLLALAIVAWLGPGLPSATLAVSLAGIPRFARVTRASALLVRGEPFIEAARVIGCRPVHIMLRHAAPNVLDTVVVLGSLELGYALLNVGALSFLGLGAQAPVAEWGLMLTEGRAYVRAAPWISAFPGAAITLSVLSFNLLGDAVRDALAFQSRT